MKNFLQSTLNTLNKKSASTPKNYTLITGGHLKLTRNLLENFNNNNKSNNNFLVLYKDYNIQKDTFFKNLENVQVFNCDINNLDDLDEFSSFLENEKVKFNNVIHADHFISCLNHSKLRNYQELKMMIQTNSESPMLLNSKLIGKNKIEIGSKILHLIIPTTSNLKNIPDFFPQRLFSQSMKHMVKCLKNDLEKNPVFFSLLKCQTFDDLYMERLEFNETIPKDEIVQFRKNYVPTIDLVKYLMSDKIEGLEFAKKFWDLNDLREFNKNL